MKENNGSAEQSLRQDRYSIRTAPQWIGPVLEDFTLAYRQLVTECNSVTDNPLINPSGTSLHGGNFQAKAVTSAVEKIRQGLQSLGRLLFTQCIEIINPTTSCGLPPNLVADPPSESFIMKGVDLLTASLLSELGFLANPVGSHVQTAEMGNQSLNSLALISARYTNIAADLLSKLAAGHLLALCQALDLRAMHLNFLSALEPKFRETVLNHLNPITKVTDLHSYLWPSLLAALASSTRMDPYPRFTSITKSLQATILEHVDPSIDTNICSSLQCWAQETTSLLMETHQSNIQGYLLGGDASPVLGHAARRMYNFVRRRLQVPFLHAQVLRSHSPADGNEHKVGSEIDILTVGDYITTIHEAIRNGTLYEPAMDALIEAKTMLGEGVANGETEEKGMRCATCEESIGM